MRRARLREGQDKAKWKTGGERKKDESVSKSLEVRERGALKKKRKGFGESSQFLLVERERFEIHCHSTWTQ